MSLSPPRSPDTIFRHFSQLLRFDDRQNFAGRLNGAASATGAANTDKGPLDSVHQWAERKRPIPEKYWPAIEELFLEDYGIWQADDFLYAGTRLTDGRHSRDHEPQARSALETALGRGCFRIFAPKGGGINFDLHVRAVPLRPGVRAHLLAAGGNISFVVLVNERLPLEDQKRAAWDEYALHIADAMAACHAEGGVPTLPTSALAPTMVETIKRALKLTRGELGSLLQERLEHAGTRRSLPGARVAEWENGTISPSGVVLTALSQLFVECCRFWPASCYQHICTCADEQYDRAAKDAREALDAVLKSSAGTLGRPSGETGEAYAKDLHVRSAEMRPEASIHCFYDRVASSRVGVLVLPALKSAGAPDPIAAVAAEMARQFFGGSTLTEEPAPGAAGHHFTNADDAKEETMDEKPAKDKNGRNTLGAASWVEHQTDFAKEWKRALAQYAVRWIKFGNMVQLASGTSLNELMRCIIDTQRSNRTRWDLIILTTNLDILEKGRRAQEENVSLFGGMQIQLTGGALQPSLHSLIGEYASHGVATPLMRPKLVFLGVAGLSFGGGHLKMTYQYDDEIATQVAYATRPTEHRIVLCDHTKLGIATGFDSQLTVDDLLRQSRQCTIVTTWPENEREALRKVRQEIEGFRSMLRATAATQNFGDRDLAIHVVRRDGETLAGLFSLAALRGEIKEIELPAKEPVEK